jgi:hypothetical protein
VGWSVTIWGCTVLTRVHRHLVQVFIVTSFTTVGYGNQPSLIATYPPCEYAGGTAILKDAPYSVLLPKHMRGSEIEFARISGLDVLSDQDEQAFAPLKPECFSHQPRVGAQPQCRVLADSESIFDFNTRQLYRRDSATPPRNFTHGGGVDELRRTPLPGDVGLYDCSDVNPVNRGNESAQQCYERFVEECESQLAVWREAERKKDVSKFFTIWFIMVGIGLLGLVVGVFGDTLMNWITGLFATAETALDVATAPADLVAEQLTGVSVQDIAGESKVGRPLLSDTRPCIDWKSPV